MIWRSVSSVLCGWLSVGALVVLTDLVLSRLFPGEYAEGKVPPNNLMAFVLFTSTLYSVAGGWITARLAPRAPWRHIIYLIIWGELMGILSAVVTWGRVPWWYQIGLIILWIPAVLLGGYLRARAVTAPTPS